MQAVLYVFLMSLMLPGSLGPQAAAANERQPIVWYRDYDLAVSEARLLGRPLLVLISSKWSPPCLRMERGTLIDPRVVALIGNSMLAVHVDVDSPPEHAMQLEGERLPTIVIRSPDGVELRRIEGYRSSDSLIAELSGQVEAREDPAAAVATTGAAADRPRIVVKQIRTAGSNTASSPTASSSNVQVAAYGGASATSAASQELKTASAEAPSVAAAPPMLDGCCVVSMFETKKTVRGDARYQCTMNDMTFVFRSQEHLDKFRADPARYMPVLGGLCAVSYIDRGTAVPGEPRYGAMFRNRLVLLAGPDERARFQADPARYIDCDLALEGNCPVCGADRGQLVQGRRELQHWHEQRVYRFDSDEHRRRFANDPESFSASQ